MFVDPVDCRSVEEVRMGRPGDRQPVADVLLGQITSHRRKVKRAENPLT